MNPGHDVLGRPANIYTRSNTAIRQAKLPAYTAAAVKSLDGGGESDDDLVAPVPSLSHKY